MKITRFVMKAADMEHTFGLIDKSRIKFSQEMFFWLRNNRSKSQRYKSSQDH